MRSLQARINDFVVLKLISVYNDHITLAKKLNLFAPSIPRMAREKQSIILNTQKELEAIKLKKKLIMQSNLQIQISNIAVQYDYMDIYAIKFSINSIDKHQQKLISDINLISVNSIELNFLNLNEINSAEIKKEFKFLSINSIQISKHYEKELRYLFST